MLTIHRAADTDVEAMHRIQRLAFAEEARRCGTHEIPPLQESRESILEHVRRQIALVAKLEDTVVGCVRGVIDGKVCTVRALVVEPARHGQGIGSALLRALEGEVAKVAKVAKVGEVVQVERIDLTTNTLMEGNVSFYERHGYRVWSQTEPVAGIVLAHLTKPGHGGA